MEDFNSFAWHLKPTTDFLHDYMLRKFKSEGKDRSGSAPYFNKRNLHALIKRVTTSIWNMMMIHQLIVLQH